MVERHKTLHIDMARSISGVVLRCVSTPIIRAMNGWPSQLALFYTALSIMQKSRGKYQA
jgi:hypothetical protein